MRTVGRGRIVLWEGASLWAFDVPPGHDAQPTTRWHAHHAIQITLSAGGRFAIRTEGERAEGPVVLVAPDMSHALEPEGRIALLFVEPESRAGRTLMHRLAGATVTRLDGALSAHAPRRLSGIWSDPRPDDGAIAALGQSILEDIVGSALPPRPLDPRIMRALDWISPRLGGRIALAEAATVACLSDDRFRHLFADEIGLPFRTYLLWRRLMLAVERTAAGSSLTAAAHEAGFADSAHLSRTFSRTFGLPAASLELT
ncbi:helix-turn-helix domain-containing protein [Microvirga sp. GCM10011540]|uniref:helix-turn-helix domain-containing protein n=1 Tax=Microvirga sp. GCM10011540 TaxID=3317338 RepID=UPI00361C5EE3